MIQSSLHSTMAPDTPSVDLHTGTDWEAHPSLSEMV